MSWPSEEEPFADIMPKSLILNFLSNYQGPAEPREINILLCFYLCFSRERKEHLMLRNPVRSKGEIRSLFLPIWALSVRPNMSDSGMISASCP